MAGVTFDTENGGVTPNSKGFCLVLLSIMDFFQGTSLERSFPLSYLQSLITVRVPNDQRNVHLK